MPDLSFKVNADVSGLKRGLDDARREIARGLGSIGGIGGLLSGAGVVAAATKSVSDFVDRAKEITKLAQLANASVAEASKLLSTGEQFGATSDKLSDALRNVAKAASENPDLFKAIGVALVDTNGKARTSIDVFNDVRDTIANGANDYNTLATAQKIVGRSLSELWPYLRASKTQVDQVAESARAMGIVMSKDDVEAALAYAGSLSAAEAQGNALSRQIAGVLIPVLGNLYEAAMQAGDMVASMMSAGSGSGIENVGSNLLKLRGKIGEGLASTNLPGISQIGRLLTIGAPTDEELRNDPQIAALNAKLAELARIRADFERLSRVPPGGGGPTEFPPLGGGGGRGAAQAIQDRIDAIREEAKARQDALREALDAFTKERDVAIRTIEDEQNARQAAHETEIRAIEDEQRAMDAAFTARERARSDEIDALREQIRGTEELANLEQRRQDVADAEANLAIEQGVEVFRAKGQSANDYTRAVMDQNRRVKDAETKLADSRKALAKDEAKVQIEERIRAIEAAGAADKRAMEDYKTNSEARLRSIHDQMKIEKDQADTRIQQLRDQQAAERDRVTTVIDAIGKETDAIVKGLELQLKAAEALGSALDYATRPRSIVITTTNVGGGGGGGGGGAVINPEAPPSEQITDPPATREDIINAYRTLLGRDPENEGAITGRIGRPVSAVYREIFNSAEAVAYRHRNDPVVPGGLGPPSGAPVDVGVHDYPHELVLTRPTLMVDMASGAAIGAAAVSGPEPVTFGGVGRARTRAGGGDSTTVNAYGLGIDEAVAKIVAALERSNARRASRGYGLRR